MNAYDQKRQELREGSTEKILGSAVRLFGEKGYTNTSIKDIADAADVSLALVFKYFESKENLLSAAYRYATAIAYPLMEAAPVLRDRVESLARQTIRIMKERPELFDFFMTLLYTSDLPSSYHRTRREYFHQAPIYSALVEWQKERDLPDGDLHDYFIALMRMIYTNLDLYRKTPQLRNGDRINTGMLINYVAGMIETYMKSDC